MAASGDAVRRSHHSLCADDRRAVPAYPSRTSVARLVADSLSERAISLAELSLAAGVGFFRNQYIPAFQSSVPCAADHTGFLAHPRQNDGMAKLALRQTEHGIARHAETMAPPRSRDAYDCPGD